ncbi:DUF6266 family protein [Pedobacter sp.]|jgi:hypothetical protein|uniref:DUF6266 family protein n=1 Tax=Pedobacter sp. TaxID=1411316 RepID=UPI002CFD3418|nr:DUF6266 family protein [Pedobacter sp.]HWW40729.1 DUF6266 family protein [Pedobacter sp.]
MAKYKNGITGSFSGKIGPVVGATNRGVDYMRSLPEKITKPASVAQQNRRVIFALVVAWLRPLQKLINVGYQVYTGTKTPMNGAVSYHIREAVVQDGTGFSIDFAKAILSRGELLVSFIRSVVLQMDSTLHITWENGPLSAFCKASDRAGFVIYNVNKKKFATFKNVAARSDLAVTLNLPRGYVDDVLHGWMHYANEKGDQVSTSVYMGQLAVQ